MQRGSAWGSEGRRVGEGETGEGQIPGEQVSHRSVRVRHKGKLTASDGGSCKGTRITFRYVVRGGSQEAQSKGSETSDSQGCEETS